MGMKKYFERLKKAPRYLKIIAGVAAVLLAVLSGCHQHRRPLSFKYSMVFETACQLSDVPGVEMVFVEGKDTVRVPYSELRFDYGWRPEVMGTENGAIATYLLHDGTVWAMGGIEYRDLPDAVYEPVELEVELDREEWRTFINALLNCGIQRWEREGYGKYILSTDPDTWGFSIYTKSGDTLISSHGIDAYPPQDEWKAFNGVVDSLVRMMKEKKQKQREAEYSKRFGKPMSAYERSIREISYDYGTSKPIRGELTASGAAVFYIYERGVGSVRIDIEEWLDIINALGKKNAVDTIAMKGSTRGRVTAYDSAGWVNKKQYQYDRLGCTGRYDYDTAKTAKIKECIENLPYREPADFPVSEKLKGVMDGIMARIWNEYEPNDDSLIMVFINGGTFMMGCTAEQGNDCDDDEKPARSVTVGDFRLSKYEVTTGQWKSVMFGKDSLSAWEKVWPVENADWDDVQEFIRTLNAKSGKKYRLPTEAEWEFAARGGNKSRGYKYSGSDDIYRVAWYSKNRWYDEDHPQAYEVGMKKANELGLHDMSGNVWEWVSAYGGGRALRGGGWRDDAKRCRVSNRGGEGDSIKYIGFRLALDPEG